MHEGLQELQRKDKERNLTEYLNGVLISHIRAYRISKGISQRKLSRMSGVTQNIISRMENHLAVPEFNTLIKLAETLDLEIEILVKPKGEH